MPGSGFSSTARQEARQILSRPPYKAGPDRTPRPLAGVFHALGRGLADVFVRPARWVYHHVLLNAGHLFKVSFGSWWPLVAGVAALAVGMVLGWLLVRRRSRIAAGHPDVQIPPPFEDPRRLESGANDAEASGDHETAVRLRFRAGLLRLVATGTLAEADSRTDRQLTKMLPSDTFGRLAGRHELIVYGGDRATAEDSLEARREWPRVLVEIRSGQPVGR